MTDEQRMAYHREYVARVKRQDAGIFEPTTPKKVEKSSIWTIKTALAWERITRELREARR